MAGLLPEEAELRLQGGSLWEHSRLMGGHWLDNAAESWVTEQSEDRSGCMWCPRGYFYLVGL